MIDVNWLILVLFGVLSLADGVIRVRGRRASTILAILEIVLGVFILLPLIPGFPGFLPLLYVAIALEVVLVIVLVTRGSGRGRGWLGLTALAAIAGLFVLLKELGVFNLGGAFS
jgi:hypothetical protein